MSTKGNIQYIADTLLLEKVFRIEEGITKQAGLTDSFKNAANAIKDQVANRVKQDGLGVTLVNYIAPTVLGRIWPPLGVVTLAAQLFGVNIGQIMNQMMNTLKSKIESGQLLTMEEINAAGKAASGDLGGAEGFFAEANDDFLHSLRELETNGKLTSLIRQAQSWERAFKASPNLRGSGGVLGKIFGSVGKLKGKWLIVGIVIWFVKTVLLGAGLVEGTEAAAKATGVKDKVEEIQTDLTDSTDKKTETNVEKTTDNAVYIPPAVSIPNSIPHNFKPSGQGQQYHINDGQSIWIVPLLNGDVADTLISWALSIYPEVQGREDEIRSTQTFNNMVSILNNGINSNSPNYLTVPRGLTSRKAIIDKFIGSISPKKDIKNVI